MTATTHSRSWVPGADDAGIPLDALPLGVFRHSDGASHIGALVGDYVLDLADAAASGLMGPDGAVLGSETLNSFLAAGPLTWRRVLARVGSLVHDGQHRAEVESLLRDAADLDMVLPFDVADYVDFYASRQHAENLGRILRPGEAALKPNWLHLPVGYHGRSGTVVVSGTDIQRPVAQILRAGEERPELSPTNKLDIEVELGFVVGSGAERGTSVPTDAFAQHVFGVVLVNDWSARDVQAWEYVPLGPFLSKSFATSVSPWVFPLQALESAKVAAPAREVPPLDYLSGGDEWGLNIDFEVRINGDLVSQPTASTLYWTGAQMLAHMSVNGASVRTGDLYASGTISGTERRQAGSLIELTWNGHEPITLSDGSQRSFLEDGDVVELRAVAKDRNAGRLFSLGRVSGRIVGSGQSATTAVLP